MEGSDFDEGAFFRAVALSGARAILIGRRALIALGIPVLTADYDFWLHVDDIEKLNAALEPFDLVPTRSPAEARQRGRYVLENSERVDILLGRSVPTVEGKRVLFDEVWARHETIELAAGAPVAVPCLDDLEDTKRFAARPKDAEDLRLLQALRKRKEILPVRWSDVRPEDRERVSAHSERRLTLDEWNAYVRQPVTPEEREGIESLLDWFARRYPTPEARLRYARRAYQRGAAK